jgi:GntR family transcriptional repressor for pyruvate dehydrogenase complex
MSDIRLPGRSVAEDGLSRPVDVPVRRVRKAFEQVADQLRELITSGVLLPGQRLPTEAALAAEFGVGRATVREALRLLGAQNLIRTAKGVGGGSYVNVPTVAHVSQLLSSNLGLMRGELTVEALLEARELLEVPAARLAATRCSQADVQALLATIPDEGSVSADEQFEHNREFHFRLVEAAGNPLLSIAAASIFDVLRTYLRRTELPAGAQRAVDEEHREITEALAAGDAAAAEDAMRRHLQSLRPRYEAWNASAPADAATLT